jgi:hypothetical protein
VLILQEFQSISSLSVRAINLSGRMNPEAEEKSASREPNFSDYVLGKKGDIFMSEV